MLLARTRGNAISPGSQESSRGEGLQEAGLHRYAGINEGRGRAEGTGCQAKTWEEVGNRTREWKGNRMATGRSKPEAVGARRGSLLQVPQAPVWPSVFSLQDKLGTGRDGSSGGKEGLIVQICAWKRHPSTCNPVEEAEDKMRRETVQIQKDKYCMSSPIRGL